jgi:hypothetical protein
MKKLIFKKDIPYIETLDEPLLIDLIELPKELQNL